MDDPNPVQADPLFQTADEPLLEMWDEIQSLQADFAIAQELPFYYRSHLWYRAKSVLDIGTGNGHYLGQIADVFPEKKYIGIDNAKDLIRIAKQRIQSSNTHFHVADVLDDLNGGNASAIGGPWDFVIARLLFQHMVTKDLTRLLRTLACVTKPGAGVLVLDACDSARLFMPPVPEFMKFFRSYTLDQHDNGMERDVTALIESRVRLLPEWEIVDRGEICVPSTIPGNLERFSRSYALMLDIVERVGKVAVEAAAKAAWSHWCENTVRYTQVGLSILTLQRQ